MRAFSQFFSLIILALFLTQNIKAQTNAVPYEQFYGDLVKYSRQVKDKGKGEYIWVVHFWASHNTASRQQIASLKTLYSSYLNRPVRIVSVSVDKVDNNWQLALRQHQMPWAQTRLPREADYDFLKKAFRHNSLPALFVIDEKAKVRRMEDSEELVDYLRAAIGAGIPVAEEQNGSDPAPGPSTTPGSSGSDGDWLMHTVKAGDTLYSLYRNYGVPVDEIKRLNGLTSNTISIGQKLKIKKK
ncbi:MAG: LysM peptidoglycan-binding domain-containing protein [Bacteroidia bacterium]